MRVAVVCLLVCLSCQRQEPRAPAAHEREAELVLEYLAASQGASGMVSDWPGGGQATTYVQAVTAMAFLAAARAEGGGARRAELVGRAERILDVFAALSPAGDACAACACTGGYQQFRKVDDGQADTSDRNNDYWLGDNMWLLAAARFHGAVTGSERYRTTLVPQLVSWVECLSAATPGDPAARGVMSGFDRHGAPKTSGGDIEVHAEGNIDVVGALRGGLAPEVSASARAWLAANVWVPPAAEGACFTRGPDNDVVLPVDHVSWGALALGPDDARAWCLLRHAEAENYRVLDPYALDAFDRMDLWHADHSSDGGEPTATIAVSREGVGDGYGLRVDYSWLAPGVAGPWVRVIRYDQVALRISPGFRLTYWVKPGLHGEPLETKLTDPRGRVFTARSALGDTGRWEFLDLPLDAFPYAYGGAPEDRDAPFTEIQAIELAVGNEQATSTSGSFTVADLAYSDAGRAAREPLVGFAPMSSDVNWIWVEGTGEMAAAYCAADPSDAAGAHRGLMDDLARVLVPWGAGLALPAFASGGLGYPRAGTNAYPNAVASAWFVLAQACVNPFDVE